MKKSPFLTIFYALFISFLSEANESNDNMKKEPSSMEKEENSAFSHQPSEIKKVYKKDVVVIKREAASLDDAVDMADKDEGNSQGAIDSYYEGNRQPASIKEDGEKSPSYLDYGDYEIQWREDSEKNEVNTPYTSPF